MSSSGALALLPEHWLPDLVDLLGRLMEGLRALAPFLVPVPPLGRFRPDRAGPPMLRRSWPSGST